MSIYNDERSCGVCAEVTSEFHTQEFRMWLPDLVQELDVCHGCWSGMRDALCIPDEDEDRELTWELTQKAAAYLFPDNGDQLTDVACRLWGYHFGCEFSHAGALFAFEAGTVAFGQYGTHASLFAPSPMLVAMNSMEAYRAHCAELASRSRSDHQRLTRAEVLALLHRVCDDSAVPLLAPGYQLLRRQLADELQLKLEPEAVVRPTPVGLPRSIWEGVQAGLEVNRVTGSLQRTGRKISNALEKAGDPF